MIFNNLITISLILYISTGCTMPKPSCKGKDHIEILKMIEEDVSTHLLESKKLKSSEKIIHFASDCHVVDRDEVNFRIVLKTNIEYPSSSVKEPSYVCTYNIKADKELDCNYLTDLHNM